MRRLAAIVCLASFLSGDMVLAKSILIYPRIAVSDLNGTAMQQQTRNLRVVQDMIRTTGGEFVALRSDQTNTRLGAQGHVVVGVDTVSYDATIYLGAAIGGAFAGQYRPDSLARSVRQAQAGVHRTVPLLYLRDNTCSVLGTPTDSEGGLFGSIDSAGYKKFDTGPGKAVYLPGSTSPYVTQAYAVSAVDGYATGDKRDILYSRAFQYAYRYSADDGGGPVACAWCDSIGTFTASDSVVMWERQFDVSAGSSRMIFATPWGAGAGADSLANAIGAPSPGTEGDFPTTLAALAYLDSVVRAVSEGKVLGDKVIQIAPIVYGGLARGERHAWKSPGSAQGIFPPDTAAFYAILDSLNTLNIPITFAVNVDSAGSYERDIIKLKGVRTARFTPQVWTGIADTTKAGAGYPVDVFGRYRNRAAYGDSAYHTVVGADSSIHWLAKRALMMTDSIFGRDRVSRVAVAPDDDWSPKNVVGAHQGARSLSIDSVFYALRQAGYVGVVADGQDPEANANKSHGPSRTNPRGYYNKQGWYRGRLLDDDFKILTHTGYNIMGGRAQTAAVTAGVADSSASATSGPGLLYVELGRLWSGALVDMDDAYDLWAYDQDTAFTIPYAYDNIFRRRVDRGYYVNGVPAVVRGNVYRLSCADLSGVPNGPPAAIGFHVLKAAKNAMDVINHLAGRTVVRFAYPEDVEP